MNDGSVYVGRFAPSPTGPLHFGSLVAALASFLDARHQGGRWLLRIEDLDPPRESSTAPHIIIEQLKAFDLFWDADVLLQSQRLDAYEAALEQLISQDAVYPCNCSRNSFATVYPGVCRNKRIGDIDGAYALRVRCTPQVIATEDRILGHCQWNLTTEVGDFIVKRKDGLFAYQLAVVVDDMYQGITDVVRGNDLLDSTPRQIHLCRLLEYSEPRYSHIPVILGDDGQKLSKQTQAEEIATTNPLPTLRRALKALGQPTFDGINSVSEVITRAIDSWNLGRIPGRAGIGLAELL